LTTLEEGSSNEMSYSASDDSVLDDTLFVLLCILLVVGTFGLIVRAACPLLNYPEWAERGMGIDRKDYVTCLPHLVRLPLVLNP
jgi:hypothetical protein